MYIYIYTCIAAGGQAGPAAWRRRRPRSALPASCPGPPTTRQARARSAPSLAHTSQPTTRCDTPSGRAARPRSPARNRPSRSKNDFFDRCQQQQLHREKTALSVDDVVNGTADDSHRKSTYHFDRHTPEYRLQFEKITEEMQKKLSSMSSGGSYTTSRWQTCHWSVE